MDEQLRYLLLKQGDVRAALTESTKSALVVQWIVTKVYETLDLSSTLNESTKKNLFIIKFDVFLHHSSLTNLENINGGLAEWLMALVLKTSGPEWGSGVQIPYPPH